MSKESSKKQYSKKHIFAGLDIGTTKTSLIIGVWGADGIEILGVGKVPNTGMKQGVVTNIEVVSDSIIKAKEEAELMAGVEIDSVWMAIGGSHIQSFDSSGMVAIRNKEVNDEDLSRVIEAAKAVALPNDRKVLHVLPKDFKIDNQEGINDPIGMSGVRLEANVHIVTGHNSAIQNAIKCIEKAGLKVRGMVLQSLASAMSVLSEDEKALGVCVADIGGGSCDLICYSQGSVFHTGVIPVGGNNFTHDVAMGLRTTQMNAENIKCKHGVALPDMVESDDTVDVESVGGRQDRTISKKELCLILEARTEETLRLIQKELKGKGLLQSLGSGIIITGGASQLPGMVEMGDFIFDVPVRQGVPARLGGLTDVVTSPEYSTLVGLLIYARNHDEKIKKVNIDNHFNFNFKMSDWTNKIKQMLGLST